MLQSIEEQAEICVARACGFAALAVFTLMVGLSWDMAVASKTGGVLVLAASLVLVFKGLRAADRPVRNTELWMSLDPVLRPNATVAQQVLGPILRDCYLRFAFRAASLSVWLLSLSLALGCLRADAPDLLASNAGF